MKKYWKSIEERDGHAREPENEILAKAEILSFLEEKGGQLKPSRRDFLKFFGFSFATAAVVSSCQNPVKKAIPYLIKPEDVNPGQASYYASTFFDGRDFSNIVVKTRDGRPIKIEGNERCPLTAGGSSARIQASLLNLYDNATRIKRPRHKGAESQWATIDPAIIARLGQAQEKGDKIALLTSSVISPSLLAAIEVFRASYPSLHHVNYDPISFKGIREANRLLFGESLIPAMHFDKAALIVSFQCDFLGNWISPVAYSRQYAQGRQLSPGKQSMSKHYQLESCLTLTGSNADYRFPILASDEALLLKALYAHLRGLAGESNANHPQLPLIYHDMARELWENKGRSLLVSGSNNTDSQVITAAINLLLENYGHTLTLGDAYLSGQGDEKEMAQLVAEMEAGKIGALIIFQCNPAYHYPDSAAFTKALEKVGLSISMNTFQDETTQSCEFACPSDYYLEAWGDTQITRNLHAVAQPVISRLFDTRDPIESLLRWAGKPGDAYTFVRSYWEENLFNKQNEYLNFAAFWTGILQAGFLQTTVTEPTITPSLEVIAQAMQNTAAARAGGYELVLYESIGLGDGRCANNPWLQELPDPISKVCWDNYLAISPQAAQALGLAQGDLASINQGVVVPVLIQPGQAAGTIGLALGYGRGIAGKAGSLTGVNAWPLLPLQGNNYRYFLDQVELKKQPGQHLFAQTQMHHSMEGRPLIRETSLAAYQENPASGNELHEKIEKTHLSLYPDTEFPVHHWGLAIDFNACTGCSTCVIACQAENNIPVIGKEEVSKKRIMHWIRVDRYYTGDSENPGVVFQPLMCQHCDHAPCENVCPVAATTHSNEGLNQMAYNRCIGTKYCINNCPYKVRRFNWFRYNDNPAFAFGTENPLGKMVLNPDVTVRERGVVEKCSLCVQRIQDGKLKAKLAGRLLVDGDILPACAQACPSKAIVFGDLNDPESAVSKLFNDARNYHLLEELHTLPSVGYLTKVRNTAEEAGEAHS